MFLLSNAPNAGLGFRREMLSIFVQRRFTVRLIVWKAPSVSAEKLTAENYLYTSE